MLDNTQRAYLKGAFSSISGLVASTFGTLSALNGFNDGSAAMTAGTAAVSAAAVGSMFYLGHSAWHDSKKGGLAGILSIAIPTVFAACMASRQIAKHGIIPDYPEKTAPMPKEVPHTPAQQVSNVPQYASDENTFIIKNG